MPRPSPAVRSLEALALKPGGKAKAIGAGGSQDVELAKVDTMELGGQKAVDLTLAIDALEDVASVVPKLDGVLGYDFLKRFVVEIDYPNSVLRLRAPPK